MTQEFLFHVDLTLTVKSITEGQNQNKRPPTLCVDFLLKHLPVSLINVK